MTAKIQTIVDRSGNVILPRTRIEAITLSDGTTNLQSTIDIALLFKGAVSTYALLPSSNQKVGDMYYVTVDEVHYFWNGTAWAIVGSGSGGGTAAEVAIDDLTNYYTSENVEGALDEIGEKFETTVFYGDSVLTEPINTFAAVGEDILPSQDITYDLGNPSKRWKDLYLSGSSIHLGDTKLSIEEGSFTVADAATGDPISVDAATLEGHDASYFATSADITTAINNLVDSAPGTLDTLNELAAALGDDANYAATITTALSGKASTSHTHDDRYYTETEIDNLLSVKVTQTEIDNAISNLVASAPAALDTLNELSAALGDDANFATTVTNSIATKLDFSTYTASDVLTKIKTVDGGGSGLDTDLLDGYHASHLVPYHSARDFPNGTLIKTSINYAVTDGDSWLLEIGGNSYGSTYPFNVKYQGYIYANTIINHGGTTIANNNFGSMTAFNYNGYLCFWFPYINYWQGYWVTVISTSMVGVTHNRVTSITHEAKPTAITKEVALNTWKVV